MKNTKPASPEELAGWLSADVFKALADPNRLLILTHLAEVGQEKNVSDVSCCCPVDISVVSRHLGTLRDAGILVARRKGREVYYRVAFERLANFLRGLADALDACCPEGTCHERQDENECEPSP